MIYHALAVAIAFGHYAFVLFVIFGALLMLKWRRIAWVHAPVLAWGVLGNVFWWPCPVTWLEKRLLANAGEPVYAGGFIEHYMFPTLISLGMPADQGYLFGYWLLGFNILLYAILTVRYLRGRDKPEPAVESLPELGQ